MKKLIIVIAITAVLVLTIGVGAALAGTGNGTPPGAHYNINFIGVPHQKSNTDLGGNGSAIFVDRFANTQIYVGGSDHFDILDHDGTDGKVGWGTATGLTSGGPGGPYAGTVGPGILFPYNYSTGTWQVALYVRLLGPPSSSMRLTSYYFDGGWWYYYDSFTLSRSQGTKFQMKTSSLLADGYDNMLWYLDQKTDFRIMQMRAYLQPVS